MAGYVGYSKSNNAVAAEAEGKLPLSHAVKVVAARSGVTQKKAREILTEIGRCEWHHTSKMYNETSYYSVAAALMRISNDHHVARLNEIGMEDRVNASAAAGTIPDGTFESIAADAGCPVEIAVTAYYGTWNCDCGEDE